MAKIKWPLQNKTAIVGLGFGKFSRKSGLSQMEQVQMAFHNALEDAGLKSSDIDGHLVHAGGSQCDQLPEFLGTNVRFSGETWPHGRMSAVALQWAAMAVHAGMTTYCAVTTCRVNRKMITGERSERDEAYRPSGGPHQESPPYGMVHPGCLAAMTFGRYVEMYGGNPGNLGYIAVNQRKNAAINPKAIFKEPMTIDDYRNSRDVIEPLKLYDFSVNIDGAICFIITTADRAKDTRNTPVFISGMHGLGSGREYVTLAMMGLGAARQSIYEYKPDKKFIDTAYGMAGVAQKNIGCFTMYDSFSPMVLYSIEEWGLCKPGEGLDFLAAVDTTYKGKVPINTSGGHLSEGMMSGAGDLAEAILQARGAAGERQVRNCQYSQYIHPAFLSIIFKRGDR